MKGEKDWKIQNKTKPHKTINQITTMCPKFKCNIVSVSFSAYRCTLVVFSSKVGKE
jgi:hypothetical protein